MNGTAARQSPASPAGEWIPTGEHVEYAWPDAADGPHARVRAERHRVGLARQAAYVAIDIALTCIGSILVFTARFGLPSAPERTFLPFPKLIEYAYGLHYPAYLQLYVALIVLACMGLHLYHTPREVSGWQESLRVVRAVLLATGLLVVFIFVSGNKEISRKVIVSAGAINTAMLAGWRFAKREYVQARTRRGIGLSRALIVGAGSHGQTLAEWLERNQQLGYAVCGFLDAHKNGDPRVLGTIPDLRKVALEQFVDQLFLPLPAESSLVKDIWVQARQLRLNLTLVPEPYDGLTWRAPVRSIGGFPVIELHGQPIPAVGLTVKRAMDVVLSFGGLVFSAPILALAAIWIRLDSPGPAIYAAPRMGKKGKSFRCYKLRTMRVDADSVKEKLRKTNERNGPFFKMENDPRITRAGRWLRKFSIDELPQMVNVLRGDMSLVGPRPHPLDDVQLYKFEDLRRLEVKPGVTGLWQISARSDPSFETSMALDLEYIENWSLGLDFQILTRTVGVVLSGDGR
jgi:exopolysaccharide biosynthesis polyprenyl glycosylphosphotransferase